MVTRDDMKFGVPYFTGQCTNCGQNVTGAGLELIYANWPDGSIDQHSACSRCVVLIKGHNEQTERQSPSAPPPPPAQAPREIPRQAAAPASAVVDVELKGAMQAIAVALTGLADTQAQILERLPGKPAPAVKSSAKRTTRGK